MGEERSKTGKMTNRFTSDELVIKTMGFLDWAERLRESTGVTLIGQKHRDGIIAAAEMLRSLLAPPRGRGRPPLPEDQLTPKSRASRRHRARKKAQEGKAS
jgi:hypothetical protein